MTRSPLSSRPRLRLLALLCAVVISTALYSLSAQSKKKAEAQATPVSELSLRDNILSPSVPSRQHQALVDHMKREGQSLYKLKYSVETERQGEVLVITIPAVSLFLPNETTLRVGADRLLAPFADYLAPSGRYKVLLAMHSDDIGSDAYRKSLTEARIASIVDWFGKNAASTDRLASYAMSDSQPLFPNNSMANRAANRRLEIFIVPETPLFSTLSKRR